MLIKMDSKICEVLSDKIIFCTNFWPSIKDYCLYSSCNKILATFISCLLFCSREEARQMFYHAYDAYMDNAYPADELMPLSCKGRWRGVTPSRGDMDDVLGKYVLTILI